MRIAPVTHVDREPADDLASAVAAVPPQKNVGTAPRPIGGLHRTVVAESPRLQSLGRLTARAMRIWMKAVKRGVHSESVARDHHL
jgi:hypothetical protein